MPDSSDPIAPDELLYRRIPSVWAGDVFPSPLAFTPRKDDVDGLSVYRAKYTKTIAEIAANDRGASYHVAILNARDLLNAGIEIVASPQSGKPGHAHLSAITYANRKDAHVVNVINLLASKLSKIHGPFPSSP